MTDLHVCSAVVDYPAPQESDNCAVSDVILLTYSTANGSVFPVGTSNISYWVNDTSYNFALVSPLLQS